MLIVQIKIKIPIGFSLKTIKVSALSISAQHPDSARSIRPGIPAFGNASYRTVSNNSKVIDKNQHGWFATITSVGDHHHNDIVVCPYRLLGEMKTIRKIINKS
jgi:hypothetical protein